MTENDNSWSQEDDSLRKTTSHVEMVGWQAGFFAQSSVLSTHYLFIDPEPLNPEPLLTPETLVRPTTPASPALGHELGPNGAARDGGQALAEQKLSSRFEELKIHANLCGACRGDLSCVASAKKEARQSEDGSVANLK